MKRRSKLMQTLLRAALSFPLLTTAQTISVQPLSTGEYVLTLEKPIIFEMSFSNFEPISLVIDEIADDLTESGATTTRSLGVNSIDLALSFGESAEPSGQTGVLDRGDFVFAADSYFPFFYFDESKAQLPRLRLVIQPIAGLEQLNGQRTLFLQQGDSSSEAVTVEFIPQPILTPSPIVPPTLSRGESEETGILSLTGNNQDLQLEFSRDMRTWSAIEFFPPEGTAVDFLIDIERQSTFWRLSPGYPQGNLGQPSTDQVSVNGLSLEMGPEGRYLYTFNEDGSGSLFDTTGSRNFNFTWTESSNIGFTLIMIDLPSGGQQQHFLRVYDPIEGEEEEVLYTNYVTTSGADPVTEWNDGC